MLIGTEILCLGLWLTAALPLYTISIFSYKVRFKGGVEYLHGLTYLFCSAWWSAGNDTTHALLRRP